MKRLRSCYKIYNIIKIHCFNSVLDLTLPRSLGFYSIKIKNISLPLKIGKFHLMVRNGRARFRGWTKAQRVLWLGVSSWFTKIFRNPTTQSIRSRGATRLSSHCVRAQSAAAKVIVCKRWVCGTIILYYPSDIEDPFLKIFVYKLYWKSIIS